MPFFKRKQTQNKPPNHIGIILDGHGRWAQRRGLPRTAGHAVGAENFRKIATYCRDLGVQYLTVYAFSTENWKRPADEITAIWDLLRKYLEESLEKMERDRVKIRILGDRNGMPGDIVDLLRRTDEKSLHIDGITLCICLNYGGRAEIVNSVRELARQGKDIERVTEADIASQLYSAGIPDPDLIIRPSGEYRLSNFLLWQSAYSELYFAKKMFPDFTTHDIDIAIEEYSCRERRFGNIAPKGVK